MSVYELYRMKSVGNTALDGLRFSKGERTMGKLTWDCIEDKLDDLGFHISSRDEDGDRLLLELTVTLPYHSYEHVVMLDCIRDNPASVVGALRDEYEAYDADYETSLWIDDDGHGHNGAPHHIRDILAEMTAFEEFLALSVSRMDAYIQAQSDMEAQDAY